VLDVLDSNRLAVEMSNGRGFRVGVIVANIVVLEQLRTKTVAEGGSLLLQGVSLHALLVKSSGGSANALLGSGGRLQEVGLLLELLAALGVGGADGDGLGLQQLGGRGSFITKLGRSSDGRETGAGVTGGRGIGGHGRSNSALGVRARLGARARHLGKRGGSGTGLKSLMIP